MTEPFDLDALAAEADGEPFTFIFGGETYELPPRIDFRVGVALREGDEYEAIRRMLGDQWDRVLASDAVFTGALAGQLLRAYLDHSKADAGESVASSRSSKSTAGRSKRTSKGSTQLR